MRGGLGERSTVKNGCATYEVSSERAEAKIWVWRSMSEAVVAGDIRAMLWKGVRRTPRLRA